MGLRERIADLVAREQRIVPSWVKEELQEIVRGVTCTCVGVTRQGEISEHCVECRIQALIGGYQPKFIPLAEEEMEVPACDKEVHVTFGHPSLYAVGTYKCCLFKGHSCPCEPE